MTIKIANRRIPIILRNNSPSINFIEHYLVVMMIGILLRTYITYSATIVWIVNIIGLLLLFPKYYLHGKMEAIKISVLYIAFGLLTFLYNLDYLESLKSIGTNINIIVFPILLIVGSNLSMGHSIDNEWIEKLFQFISMLGTIAVIAAFFTGISDVLRVYQGRLGVYRAEIAGIFYGKNIYGAFVSLSLGTDIYRYNVYRKNSLLLIIIPKIIAIVLSFSRAALLQAIIMLFSFYWFNRKRSVKEWFFLIVAVFTLVVLLFTSTDFFNFLRNSVLRVDVGDAGRAFLRRRAIERVGSNVFAILFGVGYAGIDALHIDIDNTYLYLFFSGGVIKCCFYVYIFAKFWANLRHLKPKNAVLSNLCLAIGVSYFVFAYFESVAVFELGLLNFLYTVFMYYIPCGYTSTSKKYI